MILSVTVGILFSFSLQSFFSSGTGVLLWGGDFDCADDFVLQHGCRPPKNYKPQRRW